MAQMLWKVYKTVLRMLKRLRNLGKLDLSRHGLQSSKEGGKPVHPRKFGRLFITAREGEETCFKFLKGADGPCRTMCQRTSSWLPALLGPVQTRNAQRLVRKLPQEASRLENDRRFDKLRIQVLTLLFRILSSCVTAEKTPLQ